MAWPKKDINETVKSGHLTQAEADHVTALRAGAPKDENQENDYGPSLASALAGKAGLPSVNMEDD